MIGRILDKKYKLVREIATGGMGTVFEAVDLSIGKRYAIKQLDSDLSSKEFRSRFYQEAHVLSQMEHRGIPGCHGFIEDGEDLFFVMDLVKGDSLDQLIVGESLSLPQRLEIFQQVLECVNYAHSKNIIHCDLKPQNIKVTPAGKAKVLDFGLFRSRLEVTLHGVQKDHIEGTPKYMAPERFKGLKPGLLSDIYSLGVILYELLVGEAPFKGGSNSLAKQHQFETPTPITKKLGNPYSGFERIVLTAMAKDPHQRFASCRDFVTELSKEMSRFNFPTVESTQIYDATEFTETETPSGREDTSPSQESCPTEATQQTVLSEEPKKETQKKRTKRWLIPLVALAAALISIAVLVNFPESDFRLKTKDWVNAEEMLEVHIDPRDLDKLTVDGETRWYCSPQKGVNIAGFREEAKFRFTKAGTYELNAVLYEKGKEHRTSKRYVIRVDAALVAYRVQLSNMDSSGKEVKFIAGDTSATVVVGKDGLATKEFPTDATVLLRIDGTEIPFRNRRNLKIQLIPYTVEVVNDREQPVADYPVTFAQKGYSSTRETNEQGIATAHLAEATDPFYRVEGKGYPFKDKKRVRIVMGASQEYQLTVLSHLAKPAPNVIVEFVGDTNIKKTTNAQGQAKASFDKDTPVSWRIEQHRGDFNTEQQEFRLPKPNVALRTYHIKIIAHNNAPVWHQQVKVNDGNTWTTHYTDKRGELRLKLNPDAQNRIKLNKHEQNIDTRKTSVEIEAAETLRVRLANNEGEPIVGHAVTLYMEKLNQQILTNRQGKVEVTVPQGKAVFADFGQGKMAIKNGQLKAVLTTQTKSHNLTVKVTLDARPIHFGKVTLASKDLSMPAPGGTWSLPKGNYKVDYSYQGAKKSQTVTLDQARTLRLDLTDDTKFTAQLFYQRKDLPRLRKMMANHPSPKQPEGYFHSRYWTSKYLLNNKGQAEASTILKGLFEHRKQWRTKEYSSNYILDYMETLAPKKHSSEIMAVSNDKHARAYVKHTDWPQFLFLYTRMDQLWQALAGKASKEYLNQIRELKQVLQGMNKHLKKGPRMAKYRDEVRKIEAGLAGLVTMGDYKVYLKDPAGKPLANIKVTFGDGDAFYQRTTNQEGMALCSMPITPHNTATTEKRQPNYFGKEFTRLIQLNLVPTYKVRFNVTQGGMPKSEGSILAQARLGGLNITTRLQEIVQLPGGRYTLTYTNDRYQESVRYDVNHNGRINIELSEDEGAAISEYENMDTIDLEDLVAETQDPKDVYPYFLSRYRLATNYAHEKQYAKALPILKELLTQHRRWKNAAIEPDYILNYLQCLHSLSPPDYDEIAVICGKSEVKELFLEQPGGKKELQWKHKFLYFRAISYYRLWDDLNDSEQKKKRLARLRETIKALDHISDSINPDPRHYNNILEIKERIENIQ